MHDTSQAESKFSWNNYFAKNGEIGGRESPAITKYWPCIQILDITRHTSDRLGKKWKQKQLTINVFYVVSRCLPKIGLKLDKTLTVVPEM